jgi:manganese/zinc/iron transport system substrate-binding protein
MRLNAKNIFSHFRRVLLVTLCTCGLLSPSWAQEGLRAVATTSIIADMLRQIGGPYVQVSCLMGPGTDPHLYKATAHDVTKMRQAHVIFYNGLHLEGRMEELFANMRRAGRRVVAVTEAIPQERLYFAQGQHADPHVWMDVALWAMGIRVVAQHLGELMPEKASYFQAQAQLLEQRYQALDAWVRQQVSTLEPAARLIVTSHDAYHYFGVAYGFEVVGAQGISTVTEAGMADVVRLIDLIRERRVPAIFVESSVSPAAIQKISIEAPVAIAGELYSDATGPLGLLGYHPDGSSYDQGTYEGMLYHNVYTLLKGLRPQSEVQQDTLQKALQP